MAYELDAKVALVSGAMRGIGYETAPLRSPGGE
jgi:NAD(P)-dependent dehydrogenase (short-subunit alcohol dehydrogenase family)